MIAVSLKNDSLGRLAESVRAAGRNLPREASAALNKVSTQAKTQMGREIRTELAASAKAVNRSLRKSRKATPQRLVAAAAVDKTARIPLRDFGARQTKKGVSYKISKRGKRGMVKSAFQVEKLGRHVFKRTGKTRLPIVKLHGPSPWGVFVKNKMSPEVARKIAPLLATEMERRIRYNNLKASGAI